MNRPIVHTVYHPGTPPSEGALPTIVAIHGHGANGLDLLGLAPYFGGGQALVICPEAAFQLHENMLSFTWFNSPQPGQRSSEEYERVAAELTEFIDRQVPAYGGDLDRTLVLGFSQGGTLAYRIGLARPARFRGVAALSTWFPPEAEAGADRSALDRVNLFVQHGLDDQLVTIDRARDARDRLQAMGITPDYREYVMAHEINSPSLTDLVQWLKQALDID